MLDKQIDPGARRNTFSRYFLGLLTLIYFSAVSMCIIYLWVFAADRYVTESEFRISEHESSTAEASVALLALPGLTDARSIDSQIAISYFESADLLLDLEKKFDLREHYNAPEKDFVFRLECDASLEDRLEYYRRHIKAHYDEASGLTMVSVSTFDPKLSQEVSAYLLERAEDFVNRINQEIANRQSDFLHSELDRALNRLQEANQELTELQNKYSFISPEQMIESTLVAIQTLRLELLKMNAELATLIRDSPDSPRIDTVKSQIRSLEELVEKEAAKLSGAEKDRLNQIAKEFKFVSEKIEFRVKLLAGAELMIEQNRSEAIANSKFFTVIQNPFLPEEASEPRREYLSVTIAIVGILVFIILRVLVKSVLERA
ncbi:MAG: hypothetical protein AB8D78_06240 [Akkermansiaceae bacterium]